jgi:hypothetical protein
VLHDEPTHCFLVFTEAAMKISLIELPYGEHMSFNAPLDHRDLILISVMLMSIKLLSPGTDDVTWLSLDLLTLILEGSDLLHIVDDMSRFGSPVNFCAQRPESLLIPATKHPGRQAQKRIEGSAYELQATQRLMYSFMIDTIHTRIWNGPHSGYDVPDK